MPYFIAAACIDVMDNFQTSPETELLLTVPLPGRAEPPGTPGGSAETGRIGTDTPLVRSWNAAEPRRGHMVRGITVIPTLQ